jgi:hypothetical protein
MGRGRQKAKQTKVARRLKYEAPQLDLAALERELGAGRSASSTVDAHDDDEDQYDYYDPDVDGQK